MFIVFDKTFKRNLCYAKMSDDKFAVLWEADDDEHPPSGFRTKGEAEAAIRATRSYTFKDYGDQSIVVTPRWTENDYVIMPIKQTKRKK